MIAISEWKVSNQWDDHWFRINPQIIKTLTTLYENDPIDWHFYTVLKSPPPVVTSSKNFILTKVEKKERKKWKKEKKIA